MSITLPIGHGTAIHFAGEACGEGRPYAGCERLAGVPGQAGCGLDLIAESRFYRTFSNFKKD